MFLLLLSVCFAEDIVDYRDSKTWEYEFTLGCEFVNSSDIFDKGLPRTGLGLYRSVPEFSFLPYGLDLLAAFGLTSSGEEAGAVKKSLEFEGGGFLPLYRTLIYNKNENMHMAEYFGLIAVGGIRKTDDSTDVNSRSYGGARLFAKGSRHYVDVMFGQTEGVAGTRVELRGQFPIIEMGKGNVYLGIVGNFAVSGGDDDVVRAYVTWVVAPKDIFSPMSGVFGKFKRLIGR